MSIRVIPLNTDCSDLLAVKGSQESSPAPQLKASILWSSAFTVQLSQLYVTTGKTIALTKKTFVGKVMSLLFNMLPRPHYFMANRGRKGGSSVRFPLWGL